MLKHNHWETQEQDWEQVVPVTAAHDVLDTTQRAARTAADLGRDILTLELWNLKAV